MAISRDIGSVTQPAQRHFIGPIADIMLMGGASMIALLVVALAWPEGANTVGIATTMMLVSHAINDPHFAHSYQLFYRDFFRKAFGEVLPAGLRARYVFAALIAPALLIGFFAYCIAAGNALALGLGANLMAFLVGWHYVKQGYGLLIVDSVLKRRFFDVASKNVLLANAYAVWITSWLQANRVVGSGDYWGIETYAFDVPNWIFFTSVALTAATTVAAGTTVVRHFTRPDPAAGRPIAGVVAYVSSLYVWIIATRPVFWLVIPAFHSLQYLVVVWRYRLNLERSGASWLSSLLPGRSAWIRFGIFCFMGAVLGYVGFWVAPEWLRAHAPYDRSTFGPWLFFFVVWVFINVHHYCLDNVMWRKDNPDTKRHLFGT